MHAGGVHLAGRLHLSLYMCTRTRDRVHLNLGVSGQVRLLLGGKDPLPPECARHPGRKACNVDAILAS